MVMELRHVESFLIAAEEMNFTRAADRLLMAQSALTQHIQALEGSLGTALFDRSNHRRLTLTAAGQVFCEEGQKLLRQVEEAKTAISAAGIGTGRLRISHMGPATVLFLPQLIREFLSEHPGVHIEFFDLSPEEETRRFRRHEIDLAFSRDRSVRGDLQLRSMPLYEDQLVLALPDRSVSGGTQRFEGRTLKELYDAPLALYDRRLAPWLAQTIEGTFFRMGITPKVTHIVQGMLPLLMTVASGQCYTVVPRCVGNLNVPGVEYVEIEGGPAIDVAVVWSKENPSPELRRLLAFLKERQAAIEKLAT